MNYRNMSRSERPWTLSAEDEMRIHPEIKPEHLNELRNWVKENDRLPEIDDEMILHFFHACFYDIERAKSAMIENYTFRNTADEFFTNWDPLDPDLQEMVNNIIITAPVPGRSSEGFGGVICKLRSTDSSKFNFVHSVRWLIMASTASQWDLGISPGCILVYDGDGFSFSHMLKCPFSSVKNYVNYGKEAIPIRVVRIVFINSSTVVRKMFALVKPFLSKEILEMIQFCGDPEPFFEKTFGKENTPVEYGGSAASIVDLHQEYVKKVSSYREHLIQEGNVRARDVKKKKETVKTPTNVKLTPSLNKLELD